jgi:hypothetical protein
MPRGESFRWSYNIRSPIFATNCEFGGRLSNYLYRYVFLKHPNRSYNQVVVFKFRCAYASSPNQAVPRRRLKCVSQSDFPRAEIFQVSEEMLAETAKCGIPYRHRTLLLLVK